MEAQVNVYPEVPWTDLIHQIPIVPMLVICLTFVLLFFTAMGGIAVAFVKAVRGGGSTRKLRAMEAQEIKAFQGLQKGFNRMQERLESLETLFMGRSQGERVDRETE